MTTNTLATTIQNMATELLDEYEIETDGAKDLFEAIWQSLCSGIDSENEALVKAAETVAEGFSIGS